MTRLRKMMLDEFQLRNFSADTIRHYIRTDNRAQSCLSFRAQNLGRMRSWGRWGRAGWERCVARIMMCTWLFQNPAVTTKPLQSITFARRGILIESLGPTARMCPSCRTIEPLSMDCSVGDG